MPNVPKGRKWDIDLLVGFCWRAVDYAAMNNASLGIDSWGVDHGFLDTDGRLIEGPMMYRDASHLTQYENFATLRRDLFQITGIAHQPFNTLYQLAARKLENSDLPKIGQWYLLPDLLNFLLTGARGTEQTQASTTQLMALDGTWSQELFDLVGWPVPDNTSKPCGEIIGTSKETPVVSVASHDTASAVIGVGQRETGDVYLNLGTWALLGTVIDHACTSNAAESGGWTNEWGYDGKIRFLKNIPGFYIINRLHSDLRVNGTVAEWLAHRDTTFPGRFDPQDTSLYNPTSMPQTCAEMMKTVPESPEEWAQAALESLVECVAAELPVLSAITRQKITRIRVVGGGSQSQDFCQSLANKTNLDVLAGPVEATLMGNLAIQFLATGALEKDQLGAVVSASSQLKSYQPEGAISASI